MLLGAHADTASETTMQFSITTEVAIPCTGSGRTPNAEARSELGARSEVLSVARPPAFRETLREPLE
jgi:hypothetical protein